MPDRRVMALTVLDRPVDTCFDGVYSVQYEIAVSERGRDLAACPGWVVHEKRPLVQIVMGIPQARCYSEGVVPWEAVRAQSQVSDLTDGVNPAVDSGCSL